MSDQILNISQEWRLHNVSGQPVPVFGHPHNRSSFLLCSDGISCALICAQYLVLLSSTEKSLALSFLQPHAGYLYTQIRLPWAFTSPGWTVPALVWQVLQSLHCLYGPLLNSLQCVPVSWTAKPSTGPSAPHVALPGLGAGKDHLPALQAPLCLTPPAFRAVGLHCRHSFDKRLPFLTKFPFLLP